MRLNGIYNFLTLLQIYAFSCACVKVVEAMYNVNLEMVVVFADMWNATISTVIFSITVIICLWCSRPTEHALLTDTSPKPVVDSSIFDHLWFIGLAVVVAANLASVRSVINGSLSVKPFLIGVAINAFAVLLYCASYFTLDKYSTNKKYKLSVTVISSLLCGFNLICAQHLIPINMMQSVRQDGQLHDAIVSLEAEIESNPNWTNDSSTWKLANCLPKEKDELKQFVKNGDIKIDTVDETHVKISWKRYTSSEKLEKMPCKKLILGSYKYSWYNWGTFYEQTEKTIEQKAKIKETKKSSN